MRWWRLTSDLSSSVETEVPLEDVRRGQGGQPPRTGSFKLRGALAKIASFQDLTGVLTEVTSRTRAAGYELPSMLR
jgi:hypothetical protein